MGGIARTDAMFIHDFVRDWIIDNMEDPVKRTQQSNAYLLDVKHKAENLKKSWAQPTKSYGFWTSSASNVKYNTNLDPGINKLPGRQQSINT